MKLIYCTLFIFLLTNIHAQTISHGPVVGGVHDKGGRIYIKTADLGLSFDLQVSETEEFDNFLVFTDSTRVERFGTVIVDVDGLEANKKYYYRFMFDGLPDASSGSFRTFPEPNSKNPLKLIVGSCNYGNNPDIFEQIQAFEPHLFLHLGDWGWPPAQLGNDYCLYPDKRAESFALRYSDSNMENYVQPYMAVEYIYDDDYSYNDSEGWTYPTFTVETGSGGVSTDLITNEMPAGIREGAIQSYFDYFPAYPAADTSYGIQHSFQMGNVEFFMVDTRNSRMPRHDAFLYDSLNGNWLFEPDSINHSMLGVDQREWLLEGLQQSEADWKIMGSSVIFNAYYAEILKVALVFQGLEVNIAGQNGSGATLASNLSYNWVGYPADQQALLDAYESGSISDLLIVSGDSHSSALDDGTNAGIPELTASGLSAGDEGVINYYVDSIGSLIGYPLVEEALWNGGGNGVSNLNFNDSYGTIEVFGKDSLRYCAFDENGFEFGCITLQHSSLNTSLEDLITEDAFTATHSNTAQQLTITLDPYLSNEVDELFLFNNLGILIDQIDVDGQQMQYNTSDLIPGVYVISLSYKLTSVSRKFVKP